MNTITIHCFQHVPFEGPDAILEWISTTGAKVNYTRFYEHFKLPDPADFDCLLVMGGPMGVYDEVQYPWLIEEKQLIKNAIDANKKVVGICLGSQLIAEVLGAKVYKNDQKEIGWFDITLTDNSVLGESGSSMKVFHWHGDTFSLPEGARCLASSSATANQAFIYQERILGLQFHFEVTVQGMQSMIEHGRDELLPSLYVQSEDEVLTFSDLIESNNEKMFKILDSLVR